MGTETQTDKITRFSHAGVTWVDVHRPDSATFEELQRQYNFHPLHLTESVQKVQHLEVEREGDYLFVVLHFPVFETHTDKVRIGQVGVFLGKDFLVTVHNQASPAIEDILLNCQHSPAQADEYCGKSAAYLLYRLIGKLLENISGMVEMVESELDGIEGQVFGSTTSDAQKISRLRQKIVRLRRLIGPKRIVLEDLSGQIGSFAGVDMAKYYSNNLKMVNKLWEAIEEAKETIEIYKDAAFTTSTEQTNKTLAVLTLIFTFTIPVTVLGTVYGMNILLPGSVNGHPWRFMGSYTTLILAIALSVLAAGGMYWYFRKKKWF